MSKTTDWCVLLFQHINTKTNTLTVFRDLFIVVIVVLIAFTFSAKLRISWLKSVRSEQEHHISKEAVICLCLSLSQMYFP